MQIIESWLISNLKKKKKAFLLVFPNTSHTHTNKDIIKYKRIIDSNTPWLTYLNICKDKLNCGM